MKKAVFSILCVILALATSVVPAVALKPLTGATKTETTTLYNGVTRTYIETPSSSTYGLNKINIVEFDLAQRDLYFDVVGGGDYSNQLRRTSVIAANFAAANNGKTPIAAVNGDLWMVTYAHARVVGSGTSYGGVSDEVVKRSMTVPRGFNMYNGEIITTGHIPQETPFEGEFWAFGVTDDFVPVMGNPTANVTVRNTTANKTASPDGINRLPANNALIMYTDKGLSANDYALDDAYEIVITTPSDYTVKHGANIKGTVTAIYDSSTTANPSKISATQIVLTARGNKVSSISSFKVGDSIEIGVTVTDKSGTNTEAWQRVQNACGGHICFVKNGTLTGENPGVNYPATILGYTSEKKLVMITLDGRQSGYSIGANGSNLPQLARDLGLYNALLLDGGGSTTMVVEDGGQYKAVNRPSDGNERTVVSAVIVSHGPQRQAQGSFSADLPEQQNISPVDVKFTSKSIVDSTLVSPNCASVAFDPGEGCAKLTANTATTNDPYVTLSYSLLSKTASADEYKYLIYTYKLPSGNPTTSLRSQLFLCSGNTSGPEESKSVQVTLKNDGKYNSTVVDLSKRTYWTGTMNMVRVDFFMSASNGAVMYLYGVQFAKTLQEAQSIADANYAALNGEPADETTQAPQTQAPPQPVTTAPSETEAPVTTVDDTTPDVSAEDSADVTAEPPEETQADSSSAVTEVEGTEAEGTEAAGEDVTRPDTAGSGSTGESSSVDVVLIVLIGIIVVIAAAGVFVVIKLNKKNAK